MISLSLLDLLGRLNKMRYVKYQLSDYYCSSQSQFKGSRPQRASCRPLACASLKSQNESLNPRPSRGLGIPFCATKEIAGTSNPHPCFRCPFDSWRPRPPQPSPAPGGTTAPTRPQESRAYVIGLGRGADEGARRDASPGASERTSFP